MPKFERYIQNRFNRSREALKVLTGKDDHLPDFFRMLWEIQFLRQELQTARIRLEICLGRMLACHDKNPGEHEVSIDELPLWIREMREEEPD